MVYSIRTNRPMISSKPVKTSRTPSDRSKRLRDFFRNNDISVKTVEGGDVEINVRQAKQ